MQGLTLLRVESSIKKNVERVEAEEEAKMKRPRPPARPRPWELHRGQRRRRRRRLSGIKFFHFPLSAVAAFTFCPLFVLSFLREMRLSSKQDGNPYNGPSATMNALEADYTCYTEGCQAVLCLNEFQIIKTFQIVQLFQCQIRKFLSH